MKHVLTLILIACSAAASSTAFEASSVHANGLGVNGLHLNGTASASPDRAGTLQALATTALLK